VCEIGKYAPINGSTACLDCPKNFYGALTASSSCTRCQAPEYQDEEGRTSCKRCSIGEHARFIDQDFKQCFTCEQGLQCDGKADPVALTGYWTAENKETGVWESYRCLPGACIGNSQCDTGRRNFTDNKLCGQCIEGFSEWGGKCIKCGSVAWDLIAGLLLVSRFIITPRMRCFILL